MENLYRQIVEMRETSNVKEVAQMLHSGNWIAICATETEPFVFSLGRIRQEAGDRENR